MTDGFRTAGILHGERVLMNHGSEPDFSQESSIYQSIHPQKLVSRLIDFAVL